MNLSDVKVYRITHIDNITHILQNGITHRNSLNRNSHYIAIGDGSLIKTRDQKRVEVDNGNFFNLRRVATITLGEYIPFYFGVKMPMLYVIQNGGNFVAESTPAAKIVYLVCSLVELMKHDRNCYFSDGHGTDNLTSFYDRTQLNRLIDILDWSAIKNPYWGGQENLNTKRKKQAEFLVDGDIAPDLILGFGCYDISAKMKLIDVGVVEEKIKVIPYAYF